MNEREICEQIIKDNDCTTPFDCDECFLAKYCESMEANSQSEDNAVFAAKAYLAEHNEWKPLQVDNLPSDILTGDYEFEMYLSHMAVKWIKRSDRCRMLTHIAANAFRYRYRKIQQEPSVEDMAEEYYKAECNKGIEAVLRNIVSGKADYPHAIKSGFIAGYNKAKENTDELKKQYNENVLI